MSKYNFSNKWIWLTGGSSGIGFHLVKILLEQQAKLIVTARNINALQKLQEQYKGRLFIHCLDVGEKEQVIDFVKRLAEYTNKIDVAIFNAGCCEYIDMPNFDVDIIKRNMQINFFGLSYCLQQVLPFIRRSDAPYIVAMTSSASYLGLPRAEGYGSSKAAARYLLQALQIDLYKENIPVTIISPGFVKTRLTDRNDFPMPWLLSAPKAANIIYQGMQRQKPEIRFPSKLIWLFRLLNCLPDRWRIKLLANKVAR